MSARSRAADGCPRRRAGQRGRHRRQSRRSRCARELRDKNIHLLVVKNSLAVEPRKAPRWRPPSKASKGRWPIMLGWRGFHLAGQGGHPARQVQGLRAVPGPRRRDGRRASDGRPGPRHQQVAERLEQLSILSGQILSRELSWLRSCSRRAGHWPARSRKRPTRKRRAGGGPSRTAAASAAWR